MTTWNTVDSVSDTWYEQYGNFVISNAGQYVLDSSGNYVCILKLTKSWNDVDKPSTSWGAVT